MRATSGAKDLSHVAALLIALEQEGLPPCREKVEMARCELKEVMQSVLTTKSAMHQSVRREDD